MQFIHDFVSINAWVALGALVVAFITLAKAADAFVDSAISIAERFNVPRMIIGIVLVSLGTTAPELTVSLVSSLKGQPEMALGNAIGSVICDDGLALPLCAFMTAGAIAIAPGVLRLSGIYLICIQIVFAAFVIPDATLSRNEGIALLGIFLIYTAHLIISSRGKEEQKTLDPTFADHSAAPMWRLMIIFVISLAALIFASHIIVSASTHIARCLHIPEFIIAVTMVALGTSVPEVATCITAARKGEGALAVGNILGADVLNICWVAGASAIANDLIVNPPKQVYLMVPSMAMIVLTMLALLRYKHEITKRKSAVLLGMYLAYLVLSFVLFPPSTGAHP